MKRNANRFRKLPCTKALTKRYLRQVAAELLGISQVYMCDIEKRSGDGFQKHFYQDLLNLKRGATKCMTLLIKKIQ